MATAPSTGNTAASSLPAAGGTSESTLASWAGPYMTDMLGKAQAIANEPYQVYQGPQTAGESNLQSKVFQGLGGLNFPSNLGQSFSSTGAYQPPQLNMGAYQQQPIGTGPKPGLNGMPTAGNKNFNAPTQGNMGLPSGFWNDMPQMPGGPSSVGGQPSAEEVRKMRELNPDMDPNQMRTMRALDQALYSGQPGQMPQGGIGSLAMGSSLPTPQQPQQPQGIASQYMNPYLQSVLQPQLEELRRQNEITNMKGNAQMTGAGAFGGGRQAIMNAENARNLMQEMNKTVGQGYASAYDKAMGQFNTEQGQSKDLVNMLANAGQQQRGIEQEGITADYNEFLTQRDYPTKQLQFQQSMMQGMPYQTITNSPLPKSGMGQLTEIVGSLPGLEENLKNLGIIPK